MQDKRWSDTTKQWILVGIVLLLALAFYRFQRILTPVIVAILLAYVLHPTVSFLERRLRISRTLAVSVSFLFLLALISLIPLVVIPALVEQVSDLNLNLQEVLDFAMSLLSGPLVIGGFTIEASQLYDRAVAALETWVSTFAATSVNVLLSVASGLAWFVIVLVLSFWFVRDAPYLTQRIAALAPTDYQRDVRMLGQKIVEVWKAFFRGQLLLCLVVAVAVTITLTIVGLPYALLMGLIAGVLELIPNLGPTLAAVPAVLIALIRGSSYLPLSPFWFAVLVAGLYIVIQQVENNVLVPRIMGRSLNLHPLVVLIGILMGASLAGILGIFLAAPALATLRVLGRYVYSNLIDREPFPEQEKSATQEVALPIGKLERDNVRAVLFDLDGTLIDTDDSAIERWAGRLKAVDWLFRNRSPELFLRHLIMRGEGWANGALMVLDRLGLDPVVFAVRDWLRRLRRREPRDFPLVDGVGELLQALSVRYRLGVVTTRGRKDVLAFVNQIGRADLFEVLVSRDDVRRLKPHPEPVLKAADALGLPPEQCVLVGDTSPDVRSAKAAGAQAVGVLCGLGLLEDLEQADLILASTADLAAHLLD